MTKWIIVTFKVFFLDNQTDNVARLVVVRRMIVISNDIQIVAKITDFSLKVFDGFHIK